MKFNAKEEEKTKICQQCNTEAVATNMETISMSKLWFKTAQIKFTHCCVHAD